MRQCVRACVRECVRARARGCVCVCGGGGLLLLLLFVVVVVVVIVKCPVLPPCVGNGRSRNPLYYYLPSAAHRKKLLSICSGVVL